MRFNGTLKKWNDEKGFGFIEPVGGGEDLFVHISEFPRNSGRRPQIGDKITFEVTTHRDGKKKAVAVQPIKPATELPAKFAQPSPNDQTRPRRRSSNRLSRFKWVATVLTLASVLAVGLNLFDKQKPNTTTPVQQAPLTQLPVQATPSRFSCDGRTHCSQMHSCEEATFFLKNCPGVEMDGNHDGVPCEQQWCTSPLSR